MASVGKKRPGMGTVRRNRTLPGDGRGEHFVEQGGSGRKQRRRTLRDVFVAISEKDPVVRGVAWERDAPWDGVWKSEELGWAL